MNTTRKREHGSGSISKRKDGTWTARIMTGYTAEGKPKIKAVYARTEKEVKAKLKALLKEATKDDFDVVQKGSVSDYLLSWLNNNRRNALKPKSFDRLEQTIENQVVPYIGHIQLAAIKSSDVQNMVNSLRDNGYSYSSIKKAYDAVNACFKTGLIQRTVTFNPALGVTLPAKSLFEQHELRFYTKEELRRIYDAARYTYSNGKRKYRLGDFVIFDANTGLRAAELLALRWSDIDMESRLMTVRNTRVLVKNRDGSAKKYKMIEQQSTKTISGTRKMFLNNDAYGALLALKEGTGNFEYVLSTTSGEPIGMRYLDRTFRNILVTAGFPDEKIFGVHSLRHTFASLLFASGVDVKTVSELLGHSDTAITYNTYIHLIQQQRIDAINKISDFMNDN